MHTDPTPAGVDPAPKSADEALARINRICDEKKPVSAEYFQVVESVRALTEEFIKFSILDLLPHVKSFELIKVATLNSAQSPKTVSHILAELAALNRPVQLAVHNPKTGETELFA